MSDTPEQKPAEEFDDQQFDESFVFQVGPKFPQGQVIKVGIIEETETVHGIGQALRNLMWPK